MRDARATETGKQNTTRLDLVFARVENTERRSSDVYSSRPRRLLQLFVGSALHVILLNIISNYDMYIYIYTCIVYVLSTYALILQRALQYVGIRGHYK